MQLPKLKRSKCAILPLVLKYQWYDMIASGAKMEEYRTSIRVRNAIEKWYGHCQINKKKPVVRFFDGYRKGRSSMTILVDFVCTRDACFNPGWGEPNEPHYVLSLGAMVEIEKGEVQDGGR